MHIADPRVFVSLVISTIPFVFIVQHVSSPHTSFAAGALSEHAVSGVRQGASADTGSRKICKVSLFANGRILRHLYGIQHCTSRMETVILS